MTTILKPLKLELLPMDPKHSSAIPSIGNTLKFLAQEGVTQKHYCYTIGRKSRWLTKAKLNQVEMFEISRAMVHKLLAKFSRPHVAKTLPHTKVKNVQLYGAVTQIGPRLRLTLTG